MNFYALVLLISLAIGVALGFLVQLDAGYVRVSWLNWLVETNVWIAFALLIGFYFALHYLFRTLSTTLAVRAGWRQWRKKRKYSRAQQNTIRGLLHYAEGNWKQAQKFLSGSAEQSDTPLINYLASAQAANELGNEKESDLFLKKAFDNTPGGDVAIGVTQAQLQLARGQLEQCLSTLLNLRKKTPHHPFVLKLLQQVYTRLNDWQKMSEILPELRKYKVLKDDEVEKLELETWLNLLRQACDEALRTRKGEFNSEPLNAIWDRMPANLRKNPHVIYAYASQLMRLGAGGQAETLLRKALKQHWSDILIDLYGQIAGGNVAEQLLAAEHWLKERPNDASLLLALGRLSLRNERWSKAKEYFEASLKLKRRRETYYELARLLAAMDQPQASNEYFIQALQDSAKLPDLPSPKSQRRSA
ncbi:heme biosynthesis HemY N-terminal domain-containing protein [Hahella sp. CR1]|uniref:heme biosynthesis HemY N-terminal domain-containing protein n=1 Tax=unclassified Hahella TaxID=2624107 RepID=UPI00244253B4|nr:heme biosynthesis HemY N-terminal domain-containing protein [Hahella sp. CR1]MDG9666219.1 heme biosynthesis protein HemY [Hahella sp. CR1]